MWSKLSNVRRMIAKLLKTMNDVRKMCLISNLCDPTRLQLTVMYRLCKSSVGLVLYVFGWILSY